MFVQISLLRDFVCALPNRGADGLAKRAIYGGVERARVSSQSLKKHLRSNTALVRTASDGSVEGDTLADLERSLGLDTTRRSAHLERRLIPMLKDRQFSDEEAETWASAILALWKKKDSKKADDGENGETAVGSSGKRQPIVVGHQELEALADIARVCAAENTKPGHLRNLMDKPKKASEKIQAAIEALQSIQVHGGLDGGLFGRMATGVAVSNVRAAVHVAHTIGVNPLTTWADFFSATDDEKSGEGDDAGASYIATSELGSMLGYGYAVIDLRELARNFGVNVSDPAIIEIVGWLVRAIAQTVPAAKLGSTAPYAPLVDLMVEVGRRQPVSKIGAFEQPVLPQDGMALSDIARERLTAHVKVLDELQGRPQARIWLRDHVDPDGQRPAHELLADAVTTSVAEMAAEVPSQAAEYSR